MDLPPQAQAWGGRAQGATLEGEGYHGAVACKLDSTGEKVVKEIAEFICFLTWGRGGGPLDFAALPSTWHSWGWASGLHYLREIAVHTAGR